MGTKIVISIPSLKIASHILSSGCLFMTDHQGFCDCPHSPYVATEICGSARSGKIPSYSERLKKPQTFSQPLFLQWWASKGVSTIRPRASNDAVQCSHTAMRG